MKFSLINNDKSTFWDEVILVVVDFILILSGILLIIFQPSFLIFSGVDFLMFGIIMIFTAVLFIPAIIYRFMTNKKKGE